MRTRGCSLFGVAVALAVGAAALLFSAPGARAADCSVNCLVLPAAPVPAPINSLSVAIGDVNGDGRPDLVALTDNTSTNGDALWVHLQGSDGTLGQPSWSYGAGKPGVIGPGAIAIGDVTGDNRADIVVATVYGLNVFPQLAGGGLGAPVAVSDPVPLGTLRIVDFNRDGRLDVVALAKLQPASAQTFDEVHLFMQTASGLATPTTVPLGYPGATDLEVADVNGDGRLDLLVGDGPQGGFVILTATASGGFSAPAPVSLGTIPAIDRVEYATAVAAADVDVDGRVDVAVATNYQPGIRLLRQQAGGTFASVDVTGLSSPVAALMLRDLSRDGQAELLTVDNHALGIWLSSAGTEQRFAVGPQAGAPESIALGDLNGDGKLDVAVAGGASSTVGGSAVFYGTAADLQVTGDDPPGPVLAGSTIKYTMVVTNAGPDATTGVTMYMPYARDYAPTQGVCNTASARCAIGTLAAGASASVTFSQTATTVGTMRVTASASAYAFDPHLDNNSHEEMVTVLPAADLAVYQQLFPTALTPGDIIRVTNLGPSAAESVMLTFDASAGLIVTKAEAGADVPGTCDVNFGHVTCALGTLAPSASETVLVALSAASPGTYDVTASATSATQDAKPANNQDAQSMTLIATGLGTVGGPTGGRGGTSGGGATGSGGLTGGRPAGSGGGGCGCATARPASRDGGSTSLCALALLVMLAVQRRRR
jgi:hypothetical protein